MMAREPKPSPPKAARWAELRLTLEPQAQGNTSDDAVPICSRCNRCGHQKQECPIARQGVYATPVTSRGAQTGELHPEKEGGDPRGVVLRPIGRGGHFHASRSGASDSTPIRFIGSGGDSRDQLRDQSGLEPGLLGCREPATHAESGASAPLRES